MSMKHVVKRRGHTEGFDDKKLYASIYSACLVVRETPEASELVAEKVTKDITDWIANKPEVTSADIRRHAAEFLHVYNADAAYSYMHYRTLW